MRVPERLLPLVEQGVIDEVLRPLMSGKEAAVYLVRAGGEVRVAKVYKEATERSFKHRAAYTEGRKVRNSRQQRAMAKGTRYGREEIEAAWRSAEVDAIFRLREAGVRVPEPYEFVDGVLVMELIVGPDGEPAPRLVDVDLTEAEAEEVFQVLVREVVKMLCAGLVHGDLSDFNVLMGPTGPVIIDFPQAVDAAQNNNARQLLVRDVKNLTRFLSRWAPRLAGTRYGDEMWSLYEKNELRPDTRLTGRFRGEQRRADTLSLLEEIEAAEREHRAKREALGLPPLRPRKVATVGPEPQPVRGSAPRPGGRDGARPGERPPHGDRPRRDERPPQGDRPRREDRPRLDERPRREDRPHRDERARREERPEPPREERLHPATTAPPDEAHKKRRRRRRRKGGGEGAPEGAEAHDPLDALLIVDEG